MPKRSKALGFKQRFLARIAVCGKLSTLRSDESVAAGDRNGVRRRSGPQLVLRAPQSLLDRAFGDAELEGDFLYEQAILDQPKSLDLGLGDIDRGRQVPEQQLEPTRQIVDLARRELPIGAGEISKAAKAGFCLVFQGDRCSVGQTVFCRTF